MITWKEFKNRNKGVPMHLELTDIICPRCKGDTPLYRRTDVVLASYPPKYGYICLKCDWYGCE